MEKTEVTVGQFRQVVKSTRLRTDAETDGKGGNGRNAESGKFEQDPKYNWRDPGFTQTDEHPVGNVSWNDAIAFCNTLSGLEGLKPYYESDGSPRARGDGYRLPTEAEWEYACRGRSWTRYSFGDESAQLSEYAWFASNSGRETRDARRSSTEIGGNPVKYFDELIRHDCMSHPVGQKLPNAFGLYDMHGNVWEWCIDRYKATHSGSTEADPSGPSSGELRVLRGGGWTFDERGCRTTIRFSGESNFRDCSMGFRVARSLPRR